MNVFRYAIPGWFAGASLPRTVDDVRWLKENGFQTIVSFETLRDSDDILAELSKLGIQYVDMHIPDGEEPYEGQAERFVSIVDDAIYHDKPVFCHCLAGRGRTGMMMMYYLMTRLGYNFDEAWDKVGGTVVHSDQVRFLYDHYQTLPQSRSGFRQMIDAGLIEEFQALGLSDKEAVIGWGAAMALHNLRECQNDLDAIVTKECFDRLINDFPTKLDSKIQIGRVELCLGSVSYCDFVASAIARSVEINGVQVLCLRDLLTIKIKRNKPKDKLDIVLLKIRLAGGGC